MITVQLPKGSVSRSGDHNTQESNIGEENPPQTRSGHVGGAGALPRKGWLVGGCAGCRRGAHGGPWRRRRAHSSQQSGGEARAREAPPKERRPAAWRRHGPPAESRRGVRSGAHSAQSDTWRRRGGAGDEATRKTAPAGWRSPGRARGGETRQGGHPPR